MICYAIFFWLATFGSAYRLWNLEAYHLTRLNVFWYCILLIIVCAFAIVSTAQTLHLI